MHVLVTTLSSLLEKADAHFSRGHLRAARSSFELLLQRAQERTDWSMEVVGRVMLARILLRQHDLDAAEEQLQLAARSLDPQHLLSHARYRAALARLALDRGPADLAQIELVAYLRWAEDAGAHDAVLDACLLLSDRASLEDRVHWLERGIDHGLNHGVSRSLGRAYNDLGATFDQLGQLDEALEAYTQSLNWHRDAGSAREVVGARWAVGVVCCRLDEWPEARTHLERALHLAENDDTCLDLLVFVLADLAKVYDAAGDEIEARRLVLRSLKEGNLQGMSVLWPGRWRALQEQARRLDL